MSFEKPSLYIEYVNNGDIRGLIQLINTYKYTDDEASEVINLYTPDHNNKIPEVEHIVQLLKYFPKAKISKETMSAIKNSYPNMIKTINQLKNKENKITDHSVNKITELERNVTI